jgi:glyoxylase-like metal-dependent hydrolase (beta-lactamase superfamily II)
VVYTGDMLFVGGHPAVWAGPVSNWIKACDTMLGWDLDVVVPGHGPITDKSGIRELRDYLAYLLAESRKCYDAGLTFQQAADRISLARWNWSEEERIYVNVHACYREFVGASAERPDVMEMLALMGERHFRNQAAQSGSRAETAR